MRTWSFHIILLLKTVFCYFFGSYSIEGIVIMSTVVITGFMSLNALQCCMYVSNVFIFVLNRSVLPVLCFQSFFCSIFSSLI